MCKTTGKKISVKASTAKSLGRPPPRDKLWGLSHKSSSIHYKTVMRLQKYKEQKSLSSMTQTLQYLKKTCQEEVPPH